MRRFRFPLARLERLRRHQERIARKELGTALAVVHALLGRLATVQANLALCRAEERIPDALVLAIGLGFETAKARLAQRVVVAEVDADRSRRSYQERRRDLRSLSRMRERRFVAWAAAAASREQAELDEMARVHAFARRRAEEKR